jgi:hypothetical protein
MTQIQDIRLSRDLDGLSLAIDHVRHVRYAHDAITAARDLALRVRHQHPGAEASGRFRRLCEEIDRWTYLLVGWDAVGAPLCQTEAEP